MEHQKLQPEYYQAGGQNVFKGAKNGMPNGAYTGYPAQPKAGYPGQPMPVQGYPAGEPFLAPKHKESCCNVQWVLFGFGWVTGITWLLGLVLPMCSYQRLKVPSYRVGWYANTIMSALCIGVGIAMIYFYGNVCAWGPNGAKGHS